MQHEIGYCYLTLNDPLRAMQCGVSAYENAEAADDSEWQINSCLLIAQSHRRWTLTALILNGYKQKQINVVEMRQDLQRALETYNQAAHLIEESGESTQSTRSSFHIRKLL